MFIFQFSDGRYYKESGSDYMDSKSHYDYFAKKLGAGNSYGVEINKRQEQYKTKNINEAKLFKSQQAIRSSNCYSWGGTIHEVDVNIVLRK